MNILVSVSDLSMGGAQIFAIRLATALSQGNRIYVYNHEMMQKHNDSILIKELPKKIKVLHFPPLLDLLTKKINSFLSRIKIRISLNDAIRILYFKLIIILYRIDIINSHLYPSDKFVTNALKHYKIPIVMTDHGDYRYVVEQGFSTLDEVRNIANRVDGIAYCSLSNARIFSKYSEGSRVLEKIIYYGLPKQRSIDHSISLREKLGVSEDTFIFGMVARGIVEKGWLEAIEAFRTVVSKSKRETHLICVGDGEYLSHLRSSLEAELASFIHFTGYSSEPHYWIDTFDVALLPTYFPGESLPNSIIEYLSLGKPVIATNIAGIAEMITHNGQTAGFLVPLGDDGRANVSILAEKMLMYINDSNLLEKHIVLAKEAFEKFRMSTCIQFYQDLFQQILSNSWNK